jgi:hypothetical protein
VPKFVALLLLAGCLVGCGVADTMIDGMKHVKAVEDDLAASTGMRPQVGFNWVNGRLAVVTVSFPRLYEDKPLAELAETVRRSVTTQFKQTPEHIVVAFTISGAQTSAAEPRRDQPADAPADSPKRAL